MGLLHSALVARASAALPAAGAYDTPTEFNCDGADQVDFWIGYDQHASASAGQVTIKVETGITMSGDEVWSIAKYVVLTGTFSQGSDVDSQIQSETLEFDPTGATNEYIHLMVTDLNADKMKISVKESGEASYPGTVVIYARLKSL